MCLGLWHRVNEGEGGAVRYEMRRALPADHQGDRQVLRRGSGGEAANSAAVVIPVIPVQYNRRQKETSAWCEKLESEWRPHRVNCGATI